MATNKERAAASVRRHRDGMRRNGLRLIQLWVPDTGAPGFVREFRRQALLVAQAETGSPDVAALLDLQGTEGWES